jgi:hypothetical protein
MRDTRREPRRYRSMTGDEAAELPKQIELPERFDLENR